MSIGHYQGMLDSIIVIHDSRARRDCLARRACKACLLAQHTHLPSLLLALQILWQVFKPLQAPQDAGFIRGLHSKGVWKRDGWIGSMMRFVNSWIGLFFPELAKCPLKEGQPVQKCMTHMQTIKQHEDSRCIGPLSVCSAYTLPVGRALSVFVLGWCSVILY